MGAYRMGWCLASASVIIILYIFLVYSNVYRSKKNSLFEKGLIGMSCRCCHTESPADKAEVGRETNKSN